MASTNLDYLPDLLKRIQQSDAVSALQLLEQAAQTHPADPRPLLLLAARSVHAKEIDRAEALYIMALQRAPDFAIARFQLGLLQLTSARPAAAVATWAPLEMLGETDPLRLFKRGLELLAQDRFDQAQHWLLQGIAHNHDNQALNRDMQMIIDKMPRTSSSNPPGGDASENAPASQEGTDEKAPAEETADHFLVSSYRKVH